MCTELKDDNILLLYGGGIDSTALLMWLVWRGMFRKSLSSQRRDYKVSAVFFKYGQKAESLEYGACQYFCAKYDVDLHVIQAPFAQISDSAILNGGVLANDPKVNILDGRNFAMLGMAGMLAAKIGATKLAMGYHVEPEHRPFPDASIEFVDAMNEAIPKAFVHQWQIYTPFAKWTRQKIFQWANYYDKDILQKAHTCYENVAGGCGACSHCTLKKQICDELGIEV